MEYDTVPEIRSGCQFLALLQHEGSTLRCYFAPLFLNLQRRIRRLQLELASLRDGFRNQGPI